MPNHRELQEDQLHEPKGMANAFIGDVIVSDGLGGSRLEGASRVGFLYIADDPSNNFISLPAGLGTRTQLTNDENGPGSTSQYVNNFPYLWVNATNRLNTSLLFLGDTVEVTFTIIYNGTVAGQYLECGIRFDQGGFYEVVADSFNLPNTSVGERTITASFPILQVPPLLGSAFIWASSDTAMDIKMKDLVVKTTRCRLQGSI